MRPGRPTGRGVLVTIGLLAVVVGACTSEDSGASSEAGREDLVSANRVVDEGPFRSLVSQADQHLVVVTEEPSDIGGWLFRMERVGGGEPGKRGEPGQGAEPGEGRWRTVGAPIPVVVGRGGVGPKQEGDGRSPQGVFGLERVFGYAQEPPAGSVISSGRDLAAGLALPYEPMAPGSVCVDDPGSAYYNLVFDPDTLPESARGAKDWNSAEAMRRDLAHGDELYRWGVVVRYNDERVPGAGSCIFLHVWRGPESPTAGCTAMAEEELLFLLGWLRIGSERGPETDPESVSGPVLIQGSRAYLESLSREGVLPYPVPG